MFSLRALALAVVFAVFGAACGGSATTDVAAPGSDDTVSGETDAPADDTAPAADPGTDDEAAAVDWDHDWTGELIGGGQIDANSLAGQDIVLWFWAPW